MLYRENCLYNLPRVYLTITKEFFYQSFLAHIRIPIIYKSNSDHSNEVYCDTILKYDTSYRRISFKLQLLDYLIACVVTK